MFAGRTAEDLNRLLPTLLHPGISPEDKQGAMRGFIGVAPDVEEVEEDDDGAGVGVGDAAAARAVDTVCPTTTFRLPEPLGGPISLRGDLSTLLYSLAIVTGRPDLQALYQHFEQQYPHYHDAAQRRRMLGHLATMCQQAHDAFVADDPATVRQLQAAQHILQNLLANPAFVTTAASAPSAERQALLQVATQMCQDARRDFDALRPAMVTRLTNAENLLAMLINNPAFIAISVTLTEEDRHGLVIEAAERYKRAIVNFNPTNLSTAMHLQRAQETLQAVLSHQALLHTVTNPAPATGAGAGAHPTLLALLTPADGLTPAQQTVHTRTVSHLLGQFLAAETQAMAAVKNATNQRHQAQRDWEAKVADLAHRKTAPSAEETTSFEATQRRLADLAATQGRAITGYQHATDSLATAPTLRVADCSHYGTPVLALAGGDPDDNGLIVRLTRTATQQLFARNGWADPAANRPVVIDDATAATRAYGFRCMRLLEIHATAMGHRASFMYPLLATMAGELVSDADLTALADAAVAERIEAAVARAQDLAYPNGSRLAARSEDGLNAIELFWHRELNLLDAVVTKLLTSKHAMLAAQAAAAEEAAETDDPDEFAEPAHDADAETTQTAYLAACVHVIDWQPHRSPLDTLKRELTAETWTERTMLRLIQGHEHPVVFSDARAAQATPRASTTGTSTRGTVAFFTQMALVDLVANALSGKFTLIGTAMPALLLLGSAVTVPTDAQPEALLTDTAWRTAIWQLTQTGIAWGITAAERFAGGTFLSPQILQGWIVPGASVALRIGSVTMGGLAVRSTAQALGRLPVTLRESDRTVLRLGMVGDAVGQVAPIVLAPVINGIYRAAADPVFARSMTLGDFLVPEWRMFGAASPQITPLPKSAPAELRCVDTQTSGVSAGPISFSVVARQGNFDYSSGTWAPTCTALAEQVCAHDAQAALQELSLYRRDFASFLASQRPESAHVAWNYTAPDALGTWPAPSTYAVAMADSTPPGSELIQQLRFTKGEACVSTAAAKLLASGEGHTSIHFVVSGTWTPYDPYDVAPSAPNHPVGWAPKAWGAAAFQPSNLHDRPAALAGPTGLENQAVLAYADLGIPPGAHPASVAASMPAQVTAYGSTLTAMRLPAMIGAALATQAFSAIFHPSIVPGGEHSRLHAMAASLLANTKPDAAGRATTPSAALNELLNQEMAVRSDAPARMTLLALYHQATTTEQEALRSETIHALVGLFKHQLTQAMVNCFHLTEADEAVLAAGRAADPGTYEATKRKTNAAGRFIERLVTLKADIAAGRESRDSLAGNAVVRTFCASRTSGAMREQLEALMLSGSVGTPTFATDTSDAALVVKEYLSAVARADYQAIPEEATLLRITLGVNQRYGAPGHLALLAENPHTPGAPTATSTTPGMTALTVSLWHGSGLESLAAQWLDTPAGGLG